MAKSSKPTQRERKFAAAYLLDDNKTRAAIAAGCPAKTAAQAGSRLFNSVKVQALLDEAHTKLTDKAIITEEEILRGLKSMALLDLGRCYDEEGRLLRVSEMPEDIRCSLAGVEVDALFEGSGRERFEIGTTTKIKLSDRTKAFELLGKRLKLWTDKVEHSGKLTLEQLVEESMQGGEE